VASARPNAWWGSIATPWPAPPARPAATPWRPTTSWSPSPPLTTELQFDEKWSFVAKKEAHCDRSDPADDHKGDYWDHVAYDPEHRLVVAVVPGARDVEGTEALVGEARRRTGGRIMRLMTSDAYPAYESAILHAYGEEVTPPRTGRPGRPKAPYR
jgi:IS1 family transposase